MISLGVKKPVDDHLVLLNLEKELIRKSVQQDSPIAVVVDAEAVAIVRKRTNRYARFVQEFLTQAGALRFIPVIGFPQINLSPRANKYLTLHDFERRRASTISQGSPSSGLFL